MSTGDLSLTANNHAAVGRDVEDPTNSARISMTIPTRAFQEQEGQLHSHVISKPMEISAFRISASNFIEIYIYIAFWFMLFNSFS